ncbi:MAG TPA: YceH family protein [Solirubrobacteraceae bacterium]|jgi:hypothetical protein|nr:YceH family protein [Solirubrobacteraceae bacterium]
MDLDPAEIRVLGCLLEKQRTTPDAYPLSLNALRLACNQATNRDPVVEYDDATVRAALHRLGRRRWTRLASGAGSRAAKYRHLLDDALPLDPGEHAVMCVLMLRGPQTPGELKQRSERMHPFADLAALRATLERLIDRRLVRRLDRRPGHKEERYLQLLGDPDAAQPTVLPPETDLVVRGATALDQTRPIAVGHAAGQPEHPTSEPVAIPPDGPGHDAPDLLELAARVGRLEREVAELRDALGG